MESGFFTLNFLNVVNPHLPDGTPYWIHKIEDENGSPENGDPATSWLPIQLDSPVINGLDEAAVFIHFGAISVEVRSGANMNVVSDVLNLLREPC